MSLAEKALICSARYFHVIEIKIQRMANFAEASDEVSSDQIRVPGPEAPHRNCRAPITSDLRRYGRHYKLQWLFVKDEQKVSSLEQAMVHLRPQTEDTVLLQR